MSIVNIRFVKRKLILTPPSSVTIRNERTEAKASLANPAPLPSVGAATSEAGGAEEAVVEEAEEVGAAASSGDKRGKEE